MGENTSVMYGSYRLNARRRTKLRRSIARTSSLLSRSLGGRSLLRTEGPEATTKNVARAEDSSAGRVEGSAETKMQITVGCEAIEVISTE